MLDHMRTHGVCCGRVDMQQMDNKWAGWWQQSQHMCVNLQQQMGLLTSQHEATTQRLLQLESQVNAFSDCVLGCAGLGCAVISQ